MSDNRISKERAGDCFLEDCELRRFLSKESEEEANEKAEKCTLISVAVAAILASIVILIAATLGRW